jgi:hypothetical protein
VPVVVAVAGNGVPVVPAKLAAASALIAPAEDFFLFFGFVVW